VYGGHLGARTSVRSGMRADGRGLVMDERVVRQRTLPFGFRCVSIPVGALTASTSTNNRPDVNERLPNLHDFDRSIDLALIRPRI